MRGAAILTECHHGFEKAVDAGFSLEAADTGGGGI